MEDAFDTDIEDGDSDDGLVADIMAHPGAVELFRDDAFAGAFNDYLRNAGFRKDGTDDPAWSASFRAIGDIVGGIRGLGEPYIVFYLTAPPYTQEDTARVESFLASIGWHRLSTQEIAADHAKAMTLLEELEARPAGIVPLKQRIGLSTERDKVARPQSLSGRMHIASIDGQATAEEHHRFFALYDHDLDRTATKDSNDLLDTAQEHDGMPSP